MTLKLIFIFKLKILGFGCGYESGKDSVVDSGIAELCLYTICTLGSEIQNWIMWCNSWTKLIESYHLNFWNFQFLLMKSKLKIEKISGEKLLRFQKITWFCGPFSKNDPSWGNPNCASQKEKNINCFHDVLANKSDVSKQFKFRH